MITAIVVDDERGSREGLATMLNLYFKEIEVIGTADSVKTAVIEIQRLKPNLVFLDYEMRDGTGFQVLEALGKMDFKVIIASAHREIAPQSFEFDVLYFLTKPIAMKGVRVAIDKYTQLIANQEKLALLDQLKTPSVAQPPIPNQPLPDHIIVPQADGFQVVYIADIVRCEADGNHAKIYLTDKKTVKTTNTLKQMEDLLVGYPFCRVHRSHIVHLLFVAKVYKNILKGVDLKDGENIPTSLDLSEQLQKLYPDKDYTESK